MKSLFCLLAAAPALLAGDMGLLNGHLDITLPDGAVYGQRSTELMGPGPGDDESLIWIGEGSERVAILIRELGVYAPEDFAESRKKAMRKAFGEGDYEIGELPGIVYTLATRAPEYPDGADALAWADIRHEDGTMQRMTFVFAEKPARDIAACRKLVLEALGSLRPGSKALPLQAREERICRVGDGWLVLPLPEGCHAVHAEGADFLLNNYSLVRPMGERVGALRLYLGHHPGDIEEGEESRKGKVLGQEVEWSITRDRDNELAVAECLVSVASGLYTHLIIFAVSEEELEQNIRWAEKLYLSDGDAETEAQARKSSSTPAP